MKKFPSITIITGILNPNISIFKQVLESVKLQKYPKKLIQHFVMDGGSVNESPNLAKKYGCKVIVRKDLMNKDEVRAGLAIKKAKGDLILMLESDNLLTSDEWLLEMVQPFLDDTNVFCTYSAYNSYQKNMSLTTRYCALFGSPDPTIYYLNKTEKIRMNETNYNKGRIIKKTKKYNIVVFDQDNLPTLGDNGHMFLRSAIQKVNKNPQAFMHTDAFRELMDLGYNTFGVVMNSIIHVQNPDIINLVKRRVQVKESFYDLYRGRRKYLVFDRNSYKDQINLIKYILLSITIVVPVLESIRGYIRIRDMAWFLHPIMCILLIYGYSMSEIKWYFRKIFLK